MKKRTKLSLVNFLGLLFLGGIIVSALVPSPADEGLLRFFSYGILFLSISLGPLTALYFASSETGPIAGSFIIVGLFCAFAFFKLLPNDKIKYVYITLPMIVWCLLGTLGTYWGLLAAY